MILGPLDRTELSAQNSRFCDMDPTIEKAHLSGDRELRDLATEIQDLDLAHQLHRQELLWNLAAATEKVRRPLLDFSPIITIVDAAPDEESQIQTVMTRLAKRGNYDSLTVELAIATVGPHDTDAIVDFLNSLHTKEIEHTITACGKNLFQCGACEERLPARDVILVSCGHCYCGPCINTMFSAATSDESCYPPRCCNNTSIPVEHVKKFLDPEFEAKFREKAVEFETVNRTYCSNPECSRFVPPAEIDGRTATCSLCWQETCISCKAPAHRSDCPADLESNAFIEYAKYMRWQRCNNCLSVVERDSGCSHME